MVRFLIGFNDIVLIQRPSFLKVTVKRVFFDRCQTQNVFELLLDVFVSCDIVKFDHDIIFIFFLDVNLTFLNEDEPP